jgi:hypothetical protein
MEIVALVKPVVVNSTAPACWFGASPNPLPFAVGPLTLTTMAPALAEFATKLVVKIATTARKKSAMHETSHLVMAWSSHVDT